MSHTSIQIRKASANDALSIAVFNRNMASETESIDLIPEVILSGVERLIENENRGFYLVAENQSNIIASLMVTKEWSDWRNGEFWWIQSVYVVKDWRRKGLYTMLYDKVKELAASNKDVCGYRLYVEKKNTVAQNTYRKTGMVETHYHMYEELIPGLCFFTEDK